jgi:hypothetical protein
MPIPLGVLAVAGAGAAGGGGSFDLLETTVLGTDAASVTFSSLGSYSAYKHLQIRMTARSTGNGNPAIQFNGVTSSSYKDHRLFGNGSSVVSDVPGTGTAISVFAAATRSSSTANAFGAAVIDILDFSSSSKNTTVRALAGNYGALTVVEVASGVFINTAAITSIKLQLNSDNYLAGSRFSLYGIK